MVFRTLMSFILEPYFRLVCYTHDSGVGALCKRFLYIPIMLLDHLAYVERRALHLSTSVCNGRAAVTALIEHLAPKVHFRISFDSCVPAKF